MDLFRFAGGLGCRHLNRSISGTILGVCGSFGGCRHSSRQGHRDTRTSSYSPGSGAGTIGYDLTLAQDSSRGAGWISLALRKGDVEFDGPRCGGQSDVVGSRRMGFADQSPVHGQKFDQDFVGFINKTIIPPTVTPSN